MNFYSGDIIYATLIAVSANVGYRVMRSATMSLPSKAVVMGGCVALLLDFYHTFGGQLDTVHDWHWKTASPDRTMIAGAIVGLTLALRDRYARTFSEAGFAVRRKKVSAEADLARQRRQMQSDLSNQQQEAHARIDREAQAKRKEFERERE